MISGLCHIPPLFDKDSRLVDAGHKVWSAADLRETTVIVMLFTMLPTSLLALIRLARRGQSSLHDLGQ
jgi:putative membrane protein